MQEIIRNNQIIKKRPNLDPKLLDYVNKSREIGISEEDITRRLLKAGSRREDIIRALSDTQKKNEVSFLAPISRSNQKGYYEPIEATKKEIESKFLKKEKKSANIFSKKLWIIIISLVSFAGLCFAGYHFFPKKVKKINSEISCSFEGMSRPSNIGSAVPRIDSTMKMLIKAISESNYCQAISLYVEGSRGKYKDLIKTVIDDENLRNKFLTDLNGYMIPAIDENNPSAEAKATITSSNIAESPAYYIRFSKTEIGEYLISSM